MTESVQAAPAEPSYALDLASDPLTLEGVLRLRSQVQSSAENRDRFRAVVESIPDSGEKGARRGIGYWVLGRSADASETLKGHRSAIAEYFRARSLFGVGNLETARETFEKLASDDELGAASRFGVLDCLAADGDFESLAKAVKGLPKALADSADAHYFHGRIQESLGAHEEAIQCYERALEMQPEHRRSLFRLAYVFDLRGMDDEALRIYERLVTLSPVDVATVMNLGVLYDDRAEYNKARGCFEAVLRSDPMNARARLYLRDSEASLTMFYDENQERKDDKLQQTFRIPITDFELSVRARNCLAKMNIKTLGDLVRKTEAELLSYKNFGETSLNEIKAILGSKNLRLGILPPDRPSSVPPDVGSVDANVISKPIHELDLSVRSRRTVDALNIRTVGDILQHSSEELLAMPNFGQTSLNEIRMKLRQFGVDLRDAKNTPIEMDDVDDLADDEA